MFDLLGKGIMVENWDQYKDLEYYPDRVCKCGCDSRIKVKLSHKYDGIPKFIHGHQNKGENNPNYGKYSTPDWDKYKDLEYYPDRICGCGCGGRIKVQKYHSYYGIPKYILGHDGKERSRVENWEQYKDLEYYPDRFCACSCGGRIKVRSYHRLDGIPKYINGHVPKKRLMAALKKHWADPEAKEKHLKAIFKALKLLPNKPEKFLTKLFQKLFPNQWKYIGDGKDKDSIIAGKCPDFIHVNQKKIIEHFGEYHHGEGMTGIPNEQHERERVDLFAQYGYQTLVIWGHELEDIEQLQDKLEEFCVSI